MSDEFYRIKRLPPYVIAEVNAMRAAARAARRGHHRSRHGQSRPAAAAACHRQAVRGGAQARRARLFAVEGHSRACARRRPNYYARRFGVDLDPETEVVVTMGSKEGLASLATAITAPGDVVLAPNPSYPIHTFGFIIAGADDPLGADDARTSIISSALERAMAFTVPRPIDAGGRLSVQPDRRDGRPRLLRAARRLGEGEQGLGASATSPIPSSITTASRRPRSCRCRAPRTSRSSSPRMSKTYSMAGWRIGFAVGNQKLIAAMTRVKSYLDYGAFTPIQAAAVRRAQRPAGHRRAEPPALSQAPRRAGRELRPRRLGHSAARARRCSPGRRCRRRSQHLGSLEFSKQLLTHAKVAVAPGVGYGEDGEGFVRIAHGRERAAPAPGGAQREALPAEHGRQHPGAHRLSQPLLRAAAQGGIYDSRPHVKARVI